MQRTDFFLRARTQTKRLAHTKIKLIHNSISLVEKCCDAANGLFFFTHAHKQNGWRIQR